MCAFILTLYWFNWWIISSDPALVKFLSISSASSFNVEICSSVSFNCWSDLSGLFLLWPHLENLLQNDHTLYIWNIYFCLLACVFFILTLAFCYLCHPSKYFPKILYLRIYFYFYQNCYYAWSFLCFLLWNYILFWNVLFSSFLL